MAAELGTNCNLGKTMASVCLAWRCPHQEAEAGLARAAKVEAETKTHLACDAKVEAETQALLAWEATTLVEKQRDEARTMEKRLTEELKHKLPLMSIPILL